MIIFIISRWINRWPVLLAICLLLYVGLAAQDFPDLLKTDPKPFSNRLKKPGRFLVLVSSGVGEGSSLAPANVLAGAVSVVAGG